MEDLQTNFVEPSNLDAEVYVLGSVMLDNTIMASLRGKLKPTDFFLAVHRRIYEVMETLDRAIDSNKHWFVMVLKFQVIPYSINFKFILHKAFTQN